MSVPCQNLNPSANLISGNPLTPHISCIQTAVTIVVVTGNMCTSKHWKAEKVTYGIHVQTPARFTHLMFFNLIFRLYDQSVQKVFNTRACLQKTIALKPCIRIDRMSNG
jgi:hypothetical protein